MLFFSSDLHLQHDKNFIYSPRGFNNISEMNTSILKNFNKIITQEDDLYLLGDIFLGELESGLNLFKQLPGKIHVIWGNHETINRQKEIAKCPNVVEIIGYANIIKYKKYHFYLSHFPTITTNFDDYQKPLIQRILCLAGHTHSKDKFDKCGSYNVSIDAHENYPVSIETIINDFKEKF